MTGSVAVKSNGGGSPLAAAAAWSSGRWRRSEPPLPLPQPPAEVKNVGGGNDGNAQEDGGGGGGHFPINALLVSGDVFCGVFSVTSNIFCCPTFWASSLFVAEEHGLEKCVGKLVWLLWWCDW